MGISYLNSDEQHMLLMLDFNIYATEKLAETKKFDFAASDLRRARSFARRAREAIHAQLDRKDQEKIHRVARTSRIAVKPKGVTAHDEMVVKTDLMQDLVSEAIGHQCSGCQRHDWKECNLRKTLDALNVPRANTLANDCHFKQ